MLPVSLSRDRFLRSPDAIVAPVDCSSEGGSVGGWGGAGGEAAGGGDGEGAVGGELVGPAGGLVFAAVVGAAEAGTVGGGGGPVGVGLVVVQFAGLGAPAAAAGLPAAAVAGAQEPVEGGG